MNTPSPATYAHHMRLATYASVAVALLLIIIKAYSWTITDSVSLLASLVDSLLDAIVSCLNLIAVHYALMPPDEDHRFGHYSAEDLASLAQAAFIGGSGLWLTIEAVGRLVTPTPLEAELVGMGVMLVSMAITGALVTYQRYVIRLTNSTAIAADRQHFLSDIIVNGGVIIALLLSSYAGWLWADPVLALMVAAVIFYGSWRIGCTAFDKLMDREFPEEDRLRTEAIIRTHPGVEGFHNLKTRRSGMQSFIQCHLELDDRMTISEAKALGTELKHRLRQEFPRTEIIFQHDPVSAAASRNQ